MALALLQPSAIPYGEITLRLALGLAVGGLIGLERTYRGRPAGFRTHALVCLSTVVLMVVTVYESWWFQTEDALRATVDPTRMAQGIMTGIGFLGAGVIIREGFTVRGLTTAASIWITAAIGILVGIGFYFPALLTSVLTLGTLSIFHWIERRLPAQFYAHFAVCFARGSEMGEDALRRLVESHSFSIANLEYHFDAQDDSFEYRMVLRTNRAANVRALTESLLHLDAVRGFRLSPG